MFCPPPRPWQAVPAWVHSPSQHACPAAPHGSGTLPSPAPPVVLEVVSVVSPEAPAAPVVLLLVLLSLVADCTAESVEEPPPDPPSVVDAVPPLPSVVPPPLLVELSSLSEPQAPNRSTVQKVAARDSGKSVCFLTGASLPEKRTRQRRSLASRCCRIQRRTVLLERAQIFWSSHAQKEQAHAPFPPGSS